MSIDNCNTGDRNTGYYNTGYYNTGDRNTGNCNTGDRNTGYYNTGDRNTGYYNTGSFNTGNCNTGDRNTGYYNTGDRNTGSFNTGNCNTGDRNTGYYNTGDRNTGYYNTGSFNTGMFNTDEPYARFFNNESKVKMSEFLSSDNYPDFSDFQHCFWVNEKMMTEQEKKDHLTYKTTGGFLKSVLYKEAWSVFWRKTSEGNKKKIINLPNFDAVIFKEITGIDVAENGKKTELLKKADELIAKAKEIQEEASKL